VSKSKITDDDVMSSAAEVQQPERLYRLATLADLLDTSISSARRLVADGEFEVVYVRGSPHVRERSYKAYLKRGTRRRKPRGKK